jgi:hypothetical protein
MARKTSSRVVYNRQVADAFRLGLADGMLAIAEAIIEAADPPDAEPFGEGLVTSGGTYAALDGKKVGGDSTRPRSVRSEPGAMAIAGWGFPGHFQELGTINHPPQPFATPALEQILPGAADYLRPAIRARVG